MLVQDILTVPWKSRGAALLYYTGDDIVSSFKLFLKQLLMRGVSHVVQPLAPLESEQDGLLPKPARTLRGSHSQPERQATEDT